jgi:hypothetical protein
VMSVKIPEPNRSGPPLEHRHNHAAADQRPDM